MRKRRFCGNRALYRRLLLDKDYVDVRFDVLSGGVSAIHKYHKFDKQIGIYGCRRGDYEIRAVSVLRKYGFCVILESEIGSQGVKQCDGSLNKVPMDIKAIEGDGLWSISTKLHTAIKQGAKCVVLLFPNREQYSIERIVDGLGKYLANPGYTESRRLFAVYIIVQDVLEGCWYKKPPRARGGKLGKVLEDRMGRTHLLSSLPMQR